MLSRSLVAAALFAAVVAVAAPSGDPAAGGKAAFAKGDFAEACRLFREAAAREPASWRHRYNLALAATKAKRFGEAADALAAVVRAGIDLDTETSPELAPLRSTPEFGRVRSALAELAKARGPNEARVAFTLPERDLLTEGIAVDAKTGDVFVSSVHHRKIVRRRSDGTIEDFVTSATGDSWGVLALRVDPEKRVLWAATAALPQMIGYRAELEGRSRVDLYDLATAKLLRRVAIPDAGPHAANDLALDASGRLYVSDSRGSAIYRVTADRIETFVPAKTFRSPQGMAIAADAAHLYVADYGRGVFRVALAGGGVEELAAPAGAFLLGIDGLDRFGDSLVVTQNLAKPDRVSVLRLSPEGDRVVHVDVVELNDRRLAEPTLGVVSGRSFFFVANSQWGRFDEKTGAFDPDRLAAPMILELPLSP